MALLSFKTLSVYIIARLATLTARQKSSWAWVTCFLLQFRLREIIIFDDSFRFASDEDQLLILDPLSTAVVILCLIYSRIYLIFSNSLSLTNTVFNGQMVFLFGAMRLLLMILMTLFWSSVLLFRKDTHTPSVLHILTDMCQASMSLCPDDIPPHVRCHPPGLCSRSSGLGDTVGVSSTRLRIYPGAILSPQTPAPALCLQILCHEREQANLNF